MSGSHKRGGGRRDSFRGRKRYHKDTYAPGGSSTDPLNIEIELSNDPNKHLSLPSETESEKQHKRRKPNEERNRARSPIYSPSKQKKQTEPSKEQKDASELRKDKKEYFNKKYCYGNFDRYYGVRLNPGENDKRMTVFQKEWFEKKAVLDIGCNVGFLTLSIAKEFSPRRILGIDIDEHLIGVARKNIRHYCDGEVPVLGKYPASFATEFGPVSQQTDQPKPATFYTKFPDNVWFRKENYVLEQDEMLDMVEGEYDVIMALSITKWIHLNWGDDGMRRFLRRAYKHLLPGGRLIIEPQPFESYRKRAKMTDFLKDNYSKIQFKPNDFEMYLIEEVGFESVMHLGAPTAKSRGFERLIDVYVKPLTSKPKDYVDPEDD